VICPAGLRRGETSALKRPASGPSFRAEAAQGRGHRVHGAQTYDIDPSRLRPATRLVQAASSAASMAKPPKRCTSPQATSTTTPNAEATFAGTVDHYQYSRFANPTLTMLEDRLCLIEGAEACRTTAKAWQP